MDEEACNFNSSATTNQIGDLFIECTYPIDNCTDCDGNDLGGQDCLGLCNGESWIDDCGNCIDFNEEGGTPGCTDNDPNTNNGIACNYNEYATCDDNSCIYVAVGEECEDECLDLNDDDECDECPFYSSENCQCTPNENGPQIVEIEEGWSCFSTYICLENPQDFENIFIDNMEFIEIIKDETGSVYWPTFGINTINSNGVGGVIPGEGYQIKTTNSFDQDFNGDIVQYNYPITNHNTPSNWSMIASTFTEPEILEDITSEFLSNAESIGENPYIFIKDCVSAVYWPEFGLNSVINLLPGEGYWLREVEENDEDEIVTWNFNLPSGRYGFINNDINYYSNRFSEPLNTGNNLTLGILENAWSEKPSHNDEIIVYDQNGLLVGKSKYRVQGTVITVWGNDLYTKTKDGLNIGEELDIKLFRYNENILEDIKVNNWEQGSGQYSINGISVVGNLSTSIYEKRELIKVTDVLGREIDQNSTKSTLIYIYNDGSTEKKYIY